MISLKTNNQIINQIHKKIHLEMEYNNIQKKEHYFPKMNNIIKNNKKTIF